jgi:glutathione synthase/RimK-type ligase-like ATP-grasp enzyme
MNIGISSLMSSYEMNSNENKGNYISYFLNELRKRHKVTIFDWRNVGDGFHTEGTFSGDSEGIRDNINISLDKECDIILLEEFGPIRSDNLRFMRFLETMTNFNGVVINDPQSMLKSLPKDYLLYLNKLEDIPVVPTVILDNSIELDSLKNFKFNSRFYSESPQDYVLKPLNFGERGESVRRLSSFDSEDSFREFIQENHPIIIQPYLPQILISGENSLCFLGKEFSHAVNKFTGDFLINYRGSNSVKYSKYEPNKTELDMCRDILDVWPYKLGYTRIDLIYHDDRAFVSEVEAVNPSFYIDCLPDITPEFTSKLENYLTERYEKNA